MTGYALAKYGLILVIVIVILYFIAAYLLPFGGDDTVEPDGAAPDGDGLPEPTTPDGNDGNGDVDDSPGTSGLPYLGGATA